MHISGLLALLLSSTLASAAPAARPSARPSPGKLEAGTPRVAANELALEVVEQRADESSSFGFVVPVDGSVEAWIDRGDDPRRCEVRVGRVRDGLLVKLACEGSPDRALKVEASRSLAPGKRTRIAEVRRPGGAKSQVFVTLQ